MADYTQLDRPYDAVTNRTPGGTSPVLNEISSLFNTSAAASSATDPSAVGGASADASYTGTQGTATVGGSVETQQVNTGQSLADLWITTFIRSNNFKPGAIGFNIDGITGSAEFNDVLVRGTIFATIGSIGGWTINLTSITGGGVTLDSAGDIIVGTGNDIVELSAVDAAYRLWVGNTSAASAAFSVTKAGVLSAAGATITGAITATSGAIGGWTIGATTLTSTGVTLSSAGNASIAFGVVPPTDSSTGNGIYIDKTGLFGLYGSIRNFSLSAVDGSIVALLGTIGGFNLGSTYLSDAANSMGLSSAVTGGDDVRFWAGNTLANAAIAPFRVTESGVLVATSATITGAITATSGSIGGFSIGAASLTTGSGASTVGLDNTITGGDDVRIYAGSANPVGAPFRVTESGVLVATNATIMGAITATTGAIGGFDIGTDYIRDSLNSMGISSTVTVGDDVRFWAGSTFANRAVAPFNATESGAVAMSNVSITGGSITGAGMVSVVALNLANRGWTQTCTFSVAGPATVSWGSGSFVTADGGTTFAISAGSTGSMSTKTYVYLDANVSLTAYQTTTIPTTAVGASKVLIAIAQNGTGEATYFVLSGQGGQNIDASNIVANSITGNELSGSIVYAGSIQVDVSGNIRSGQTIYNDPSNPGWFLGNSGGASKLSIGNTTNYLTWDGTYLKIRGSFDVGSGGLINNASYLVANLPVAVTIVGFNNPSALG
jgi:hypothetical protein